VKTVSQPVDKVIHETFDTYRAEDNIHPWKLQRIVRTITSYLSDHRLSLSADWQFDIITVVLNQRQELVRIKTIENVIL
jgi:Holliday junction resolvase-like predicted endonuclease